MPLTPFHLGAIFLLGHVFHKHIDMVALLLGRIKAFPVILYSSIIGTLSHVFMDAFHHHINPFYPMLGNPFPQTSHLAIHSITGVLCLIALVIYIKYYWKKEKTK